MSIQQSGTPGSDKPVAVAATIEHLKDETPEEHVEHVANRMASKGEQTLKNSESNNLFTK